MISAIQKKTAQAVVNIFESGRPLGDYGCVAVTAGDSGHLTYGRSQTTLGSGNLALLLHAYCYAGGLLSDALESFLPAFDRCDARLDADEAVKSLLRNAGSDPVMHAVQDAFFDRVYWRPALSAAGTIGAVKALSVAVVYDSLVHGSYQRIRDLTNRRYGMLEEAGETTWIAAYVSTRRDWLAAHRSSLLRRTVYRMDAFRTMMDEDKWNLPLPLTVRNVVISGELFNKGYPPPVVVSAADRFERVLFLTRPMMRGKDVKRLQRALGFSGKETDGVFGDYTDAAVRKFQKTHGLKIDGKAGPATRSKLGL